MRLTTPAYEIRDSAQIIFACKCEVFPPSAGFCSRECLYRIAFWRPLYEKRGVSDLGGGDPRGGIGVERHVVEVGDGRAALRHRAMEVALRHRRYFGDHRPALPAIAALEHLAI